MLSKSIGRLAWGYNPGLPEEFRAAWGARAIYSSYGGGVDLVHDRQDAIGPRDEIDELVRRLNGGVNREWMAAVERLPLRGDRGEEFTVYDQDGLVVKVNTNGSGGYLYVVAYLV